MKERIKLKVNERGWTDIEVEVAYNKGGTNYFTGRYERRGYYLHVQPIERRGGMVSFDAYSGFKDLLKEVGRKSDKAQKEAEEIAVTEAKEWVECLCKRYHLELEAE